MPQHSEIESGRAALAAAELDRALALAIAVLKQAPRDGHGWLLLADTMRAAGRQRESVDHYIKATRMLDDASEAWRGIAQVAAELGQGGPAIDAWSELVALNPADCEVLIEAALSTHRMGGVRQAIIWLEEVLSVKPLHPVAHLKLGFIRENRAEYELAEHHFEQVLGVEPQSTDARVGLARVALQRRDLPRARELLAACVERGARSAAFVISWADLCKAEGRASDALLQLEGLGAAGENLPAELRRIVLHRTADALDHAQRHSEAFDVYCKANALGGQAAASISEQVTQLIAAFGDLRFSQPVPSPDADRLIFILGMPRSGSSLVEQILSAHPEVHGCGELEALRGVTRGAERAGIYPAGIGSIAPSTLNRLRAQYRGGLPDVSEARLTDKMPRNALFLGMLALLYPGARVIHTRRDPVDTCWSCFKTAFGNGLSHTNSLRALGRYHQDLDRLMAFWKDQLPLRFHTVQYETLVQEPEAEMRSLIGFAGLQWDPACLDFHRSGRRVMTASRGQADRPLYTQGINNSAPYHPFLEELFCALGPLSDQTVRLHPLR